MNVVNKVFNLRNSVVCRKHALMGSTPKTSIRLSSENPMAVQNCTQGMKKSLSIHMNMGRFKHSLENRS